MTRLACPKDNKGKHHFTVDGQCMLCDLNPLEVARKLPVALAKALTDLLSWMPTPGVLDELPKRKRSVKVSVHVDDIRAAWRVIDDVMQAAQAEALRLVGTPRVGVGDEGVE